VFSNSICAPVYVLREVFSQPSQTPREGTRPTENWDNIAFTDLLFSAGVILKKRQDACE
jgi:hypothetical protein